MENKLLFVFLGLFPIFAHAENCEFANSTIKTPLGILRKYKCIYNDDQVSEWRLNEKILHRGYLMGMVDMNGTKSNGFMSSLVLFSGEPYGQPQPAICLDKIYLGDFSGNKPRLFEFGITNSCNTYHWASWGKGNSAVIAITRNVKIRYKNGKFTFPDWEDYISNLLSATGSNKAADYKPFVHELPFPAAPLK